MIYNSLWAGAVCVGTDNGETRTIRLLELGSNGEGHKRRLIAGVVVPPTRPQVSPPRFILTNHLETGLLTEIVESSHVSVVGHAP